MYLLEESLLIAAIDVDLVFLKIIKGGCIDSNILDVIASLVDDLVQQGFIRNFFVVNDDEMAACIAR